MGTTGIIAGGSDSQNNMISNINIRGGHFSPVYDFDSAVMSVCTWLINFCTQFFPKCAQIHT